jgi:NAD(P)-dependent dehydrogenase (short-subunit alcohol dehydrogenase family)
MQIAGSTTVITGGASGLGRATAERLHAAGGSVVLLDLARSAGKEVAAGLGDRALFAPADVTSPDEVGAALEAAVGRFGGVQGLVNCAGIGTGEKTFGKRGSADLTAFSRTIQVNLIGTFNCIRLAATAMSANEPDADGCRGAIVNTSSVAAEDGQIGQAAYSSSKGGIVGLTLPVARDLSAVGVRVNTILPGLIDTPIYGSGDSVEQFKERLGVAVLFPKRLGRADEFASMVIELLANSYMNAECIRLDAGIRMQPK